MYHFIAIGEFKLELQSENAQFGSNSTIFRDVRPWNLTDNREKQWGTSSMLLQALCSISYPLVNSTWSDSPKTPNLGQIQRVLEPCDLQILWITFINNRAPLLCYFTKNCLQRTGTKAIAVSRFNEKLSPANWMQGVTAISRKISRFWAPRLQNSQNRWAKKWGPTCDREIYIYTTTMSNGPLARYVKLRAVHASGMPGTFSPATAG